MAREKATRVTRKKFKERERYFSRKRKQPKSKLPAHDCWNSVEYVETDGVLGQAYYCRVCGALLQVG